MIEYKYPEEKLILIHYAKLLSDIDAEQIITDGHVKNKSQAIALRKFYWSMVDQAVTDEGVGVPVMELEGHAHWLEYIFHSLNGYLVSNGYENEWDAED